MKIKKLLYWQWHSFLKKGVEEALETLFPGYQTFFYQLTDWEEDDAFRVKFRETLSKDGYDGVFSINFNPMISELCREKGIPYISWVYDSPIHIRNLDSLKNEINRAFFFDRGETEALKAAGFPVLHMPLSGDVKTFQKTIREASSSKRREFRSEISFVGQLYPTEYDYYMGPLTPYQRGFLEGILNAQSKVYGGFLIPELLTEELLTEMNKRYHAASGGTAEITERELLYLLSGEVTRRERVLILSLLSLHYLVDLYSSDTKERLPKPTENGEKGCRKHPYIDYYREMPLAFANAEINLNISLKCIRTGVPLRVFDVLSCGGFLITNFQAELPELFEIGRELVCYSSVAELKELVDYYLRHEEERKRIAENGLRRIQECYTPEIQMKKIFGKI